MCTDFQYFCFNKYLYICIFWHVYPGALWQSNLWRQRGLETVLNMSSTAPFTLHGLTYHDCVYSSCLCSFWRKVFLNNTVSIILSFNARPNSIKYVVKTLSFGIAGNLTNFIITKYVEVIVFSYFSSKMWDLRIFCEWALF